MIDFRSITIDDKQWIVPLLAAANMRGCQHSFVNLFAWSKIYKYQVAQVANHLVVKGQIADGTQYYFYPAGHGDPQPVIEAMQKDAADHGHDFIFFGLSPENVAVLKNIFPGKFIYKEFRDSFDYLYYLHKLVALPGKDFQSKRNHINRFQRNHSWNFEPITPANLTDCWEMNQMWYEQRKCKENKQLVNEKCAIRQCFDYFTELDLEGGLLRVDGSVIAYTMGSRLNSDTYDIHIEKAFTEIQGAYQMINREFAALIQKIHPEIIYVNREEDMGDPGLRKAKLSYHPVRMEKKYFGKYIAQ
ncbi:MAG: DUF2156 domain-containing protein [bacterium]|jgi:hypothetical protein